MTNLPPERTVAYGRTLPEVLELHNLQAGYFAGKTILDLGCGYSDLQGDLALVGIESHVTGIDGDPDRLAFPPGKVKATTLVLGDIAGPLDIEDESIDIALASWSFPLYARSAERITSFYQESQRVVRVGGMLSVAPILVRAPLGDGDTIGRETWNSRYRAAHDGKASIENSPNWRSTSDNPELLQAIKLRS